MSASATATRGAVSEPVLASWGVAEAARVVVGVLAGATAAGATVTLVRPTASGMKPEPSEHTTTAVAAPGLAGTWPVAGTLAVTETEPSAAGVTSSSMKGSLGVLVAGHDDGRLVPAGQAAEMESIPPTTTRSCARS